MLYSWGGTLRSSGAASPALGALLARFAFPAAGAPRFLLAAICARCSPDSRARGSGARISGAGGAVTSLPALAGVGRARFPGTRWFRHSRCSRCPAMPFSAPPPASGERYALSASLDNARHLSSLLRAVHFQDHATCLATASGLRVTVEDAKCIQANAFIQVPGHR